jgi:hypothetical protein
MNGALPPFFFASGFTLTVLIAGSVNAIESKGKRESPVEESKNSKTEPTLKRCAGKALAEAKKPNRLSDSGTPYPDGG